MRKVPESTDQSARDVLSRYPGLRDDHLRYLEQWGLVRPTVRPGTGRMYGFSDLAVIRQTSAALGEGRSFRAVVRQLVAEHHGQLTLDFRLDAQPARVLALPVRDQSRSAEAGAAESQSLEDVSRAEAFFQEAASLDATTDAAIERAAELYRRALLADPYLVAALINLGNLHYGQGRLPEALALYEQAATLAPDFFEAHYNRANVLHDTGRFEDAADAYRAALGVDSSHADAHFYLAVTLEKNGQSQEARAHWRAYQRLAPNGEWVDLAREFSDESP